MEIAASLKQEEALLG